MYCTIQVNAELETVYFNCTVKETIINGEAKYGKRYFRAPIKETVAGQLKTKSEDVYRAEKANELMREGDPEPHLYSTSVLHTAKTEFNNAQYLDRDPIKAICLMKQRIFKSSIHNIGFDPCLIHYWTNHQIHIFRNYSSKHPSCICIDATGSIVKKVQKHTNYLSKHIFLYQIVVNCDGEQFSVAQMLSESHHTNMI